VQKSQVVETVRYVVDQCADDIQKHCAGVKFGHGRIFSCLVEKMLSLTNACRTLIPEMKQRLN
jgi:nitrogen regulatory protein PII